MTRLSADVIVGVAWPVVIGLVVLGFRRPIYGFLAELETFKGPGGTEFSRSVSDRAAALIAEPSDLSAPASQTPAAEEGDSSEKSEPENPSATDGGDAGRSVPSRPGLPDQRHDAARVWRSRAAKEIELGLRGWGVLAPSPVGRVLLARDRMRGLVEDGLRVARMFYPGVPLPAEITERMVQVDSWLDQVMFEPESVSRESGRNIARVCLDTIERMRAWVNILEDNPPGSEYFG